MALLPCLLNNDLVKLMEHSKTSLDDLYHLNKSADFTFSKSSQSNLLVFLKSRKGQTDLPSHAGFIGDLVVLLDIPIFFKRSLVVNSLGRVCLSMIALTDTLMPLATCLDLCVSIIEGDHVRDLNMS